MFGRDLCVGCSIGIAFFKVIPGRLCSICFDKIRRDTEFNTDEMHELDLNQIKISLGIKPNKPKNPTP